MSYRKGKTKFRKAFRHLKKVPMSTDQMVKMYALKGMCKALMKMCKGAPDGAGVGGSWTGDGQGGPPSPGGNAGSGITPPSAAPDTPFSLAASGGPQTTPAPRQPSVPSAPTGGGYPTGGSTSPDSLVTGYMAMGTADLGTLRKSGERFDQAFKHIAQFYVHDVVRQQAMQCSAQACDLLMELYGGETTAPEPRV